MKRIDVAIAVVFRVDHVLICKRRVDAHLGGFWEFPGGKVEQNEDLKTCLIRELREELEISADILAALPVIEHDYPDRRVRLHPFLCAHTAGEPKAIGCEEARWVHYSSLNEYKFPPANEVLLTEIVEVLQKQN